MLFLGKSIVDLRCTTIEHQLREKIVGSKVSSVDTYGKNIVIRFSGGNPVRRQFWCKKGNDNNLYRFVKHFAVASHHINIRHNIWSTKIK